jgi:hypothetical protein
MFSRPCRPEILRAGFARQRRGNCSSSSSLWPRHCHADGRQWLRHHCLRSSRSAGRAHGRAVTSRCRSAVPTANPKQLTDARESVDNSIDERSLQVDLVRLDRAVPVAGCVGSRNPCSSTPAQRPAAQIHEASSPQQHRSAAACWALSAWLPGFWTL